MPEFRPRKGSYIKERNGSFYYRRAIPMAYRHAYGGMTEWNIPLKGRTQWERVSEAHAHAHQHNQEMELGLGGRIISQVEQSWTADAPDLSLRLDLSKLPVPVGQSLRPLMLHRDGTIVETFKIALSRDPDFSRAAERDGFFAMSYNEGLAQTDLNRLIRQARYADTEDRKEIAELKLKKIKSAIDSLERLRGETMLTVLPKWEKREQPRLTAQGAHRRRVQKFVDLDGKLPVASITERHIIEFVNHLETLTHIGHPMAATTKADYIATVAALLSFAVSSDLIKFDPAHKVQPPKELRPKIAQSWQAFDKAEVKKLVDVATQLGLDIAF